MKYFYLLFFISITSCVSTPTKNIEDNSLIGFINSQEYFNKVIPFSIKFPKEVFVRKLNKLYDQGSNKDRNLFRIFKYDIRLGVLLNPQFDCHSYPVADFNKEQLSIEDFIKTIDEKQRSFGNEIPNYTPIKTLSSNSGLIIKTRSSQTNHLSYKIIAKQFVTKVNNNLIFCVATYEKDSKDDIEFFDNIIKSFSNKVD